ncbi:proline-rich protein 32 [Myotis myotis]|uniref:Proline rich 32 n=1 Tax=Myotis myotis TaxID=51298 RepID=A0A7J7YFC1_MYOMY|nr:proline-rich protein 32 [Myotis myotis]KAF6360544.1 proline rich 32 [Myotis myotis]
MACIENVLEEHASSLIAMTVDENVKPRPDPNKLLQRSSTMLKEEAESWGKPRRPLRPPLYVPPELTRGQLEGPRERRGSCIPVDTSRALQHPYWSPPAAAKGSLATAEVNSSVRLAGWGQMGHDPINVSQKFPGRSPSVMIEGTRISNEGAESGVNKAKFHSVLQQGQGFFPLRSPLTKDPPPIPTIRSGIKMEVPPVNVKMAGNEKMAQAAFPLGGPGNPMNNCPRPTIMPANVARVGWFTNGPCFMPPGPPSSHPLLNLPLSFSPPPMLRPPLRPYFGNFPSSELPSTPFLNRENKS